MTLINSTINYVKSGFKNVHSEVKQLRLNICKSCEYYNSTFVQCKQCGCLLEIKTLWATEKCPLDKWGPEIPTDSSQPQINDTSASSSCGCNKK